MSQRVLSDMEFAHLVNEGGASRRTATKEAGPASGVYVSVPGSEDVYGHPVTATDVARHRATLPTRGYQGGWRDGDERFLDRSVRLHTPAVAMGVGEQWGQRAVYDASADRSRFIDQPGDWPTNVRVKH